VQWIPLYQVSERELAIIANTMDQAFDEVLMWRGDLFASRSIVALVGHQGPAIVDPNVWSPGRTGADGTTRPWRRPLRGHGPADVRGQHHPQWPVRRRADQHRRCPAGRVPRTRTHRDVRTGDARFVTGSERERLYDDLLDAVPVDEDPALVLLDDRQRGYVRAGRRYHSAYRR
jgi:spermidine synthase